MVDDGSRPGGACRSPEDRRSANEPSPIKATWQRWNDYGIGLLLEGATKGGQKGELKQAEEIFRKVAELGRSDGWVNLARVYQREGRIPDALAALEKAASHKEPAAPWVINWLTGQINASQRSARRGDRQFRVGAGDARFPTGSLTSASIIGSSTSWPRRSTPDGAAACRSRARAQGVAEEGDRRLPPHPGHRLRERRGALRAGPGFRRSRLGTPDAG